MIDIIFANVGSGKTTYASKKIQQEYKKMINGKSKYEAIYCNQPIKNSIHLDISKSLHTHAFKNSLLIIDDASIEYNNRIMRMTPNEIQFFKLHRHYNTDIIIISQSWEDLDITLRRMYSRLYLMRNLHLFNLTMVREIRRFIMIDDKEQIIEGFKFVKLPKIFSRKKWYKYFNSYWIPDTPIYENPITTIQPRKKIKKLIKALSFTKKIS